MKSCFEEWFSVSPNQQHPTTTVRESTLATGNLHLNGKFNIEDGGFLKRGSPKPQVSIPTSIKMV